jgi:Predicted xylanase/chitin deacetylase
VGAPVRRNAWGEAPDPDPVRTFIAARTAQVGIPAAAALGALAPALPPGALLPTVLGGGAAVAAGLSAYFVATFFPRSSFGHPLLVRLPAGAGADAVALTFDDGPHPETTPRLLDLLAAHEARATFFLVGERASQFPALARRIADEGHALGAHGLRHQAMVLTPPAQLARELSEARARIEEASGRGLGEEPWLRPPHGFKTWRLCRTATRLGWRLAAWSVDPRDYDREVTAGVLARRMTSRIGPGDVVLLHERPGVSAVTDALPAVLAWGRGGGLRFVALPPPRSSHAPVGLSRP